MLTESSIDAAVLAAYRRTEYRMAAGFALWIDEHNADLEAWQLRHGEHCSAFVCAVNPRSVQLSHHENRARHERLRTQLTREGLYFEEGQGIDPERSWPPEPGFLIAGVDPTQARRLGRQFDQNAVIWSGAEAIPHLLLLR